MTLESLLLLSGLLFCIGLYGVLTRRNVIVMLMAIELMFNAVNIALVAFSRFVVPATLATSPGTLGERAVQMVLTGQVFALFIITVAAAEVALGMAIVIALYRNRETVDIGEANLMKQ
ncbi:MAG: NADH-quinone oxidoreductase subunit NuoK [Dehalococcoidia bacterium]